MSVIRRLSGLIYQKHELRQAAGILFVTVLISNVLGLARNVVIANRVGLTYGSIGPLDNYYAAFVLPDLLYNIVIVGALSSAILPLLVRLDTKEDQQKFWHTYNVLVSTGFTIVFLALGVLYFLLPTIVPHLFSGFAHDDIQLTTQLSQVLLLSPIFFTISQISSSALQAKKFFLAPALAPIIYNLAIITAALLIPKFGLPVLAAGVIIGALGHFVVQIPALIGAGWRFRFEFGGKHEAVRHVLKLMIPRAIALTSTQLLLIAFYHLASRFNSGAIAIYRLTDDLQTAPILLLANTLAMAIFPDFARHIAKERHQEFEELVGKAIRFLLFIFVPVTLFLLIERETIINLYLAIGHTISQSETQLAVRTYSNFVISAFFQAAVLLLARAYFARSDTYRPTLYSLISIGVAWVLAIIFARTTNTGVPGLSLAFSVGSFLNAILLWANIGLPLRVLWRDSVGRVNLPIIGLGAIITAGATVVSRQAAPQIAMFFGGSPSLQNLLSLVLVFVVTVVVYLVWASIFSLEQWQLIKTRQTSTPK